MAETKKKAAKKQPYQPSPWSYIKGTPPDDARKLTLFIAGAVPSLLDQRLDKLTANYDKVTIMCAGKQPGESQSEMEEATKNWARQRGQQQVTIPWKDLNTYSGYMQFMMPDGNKAAVTYDDGHNTKDMKFAKALGQEKPLVPENKIQYKSIKVEPKDIADDFTKAVEKIPVNNTGLSK